MERWQGKVAVVTGASAGIGAAVAELLVEAGVKVVGLARRKEKLEEIAEKFQKAAARFYFLPVDITEEEEVLKAFRWIKDNLGPVHILVNSAGVSRATSLHDGRTDLWKDILQTNVLALSIVTREAVRDMRANNVDGHIVHINSVSGHPICAARPVHMYTASKYAVTAMAECLRVELVSAGSKIKVSSVSPGLTATEIFQASSRASGFQDIYKADKKIFSAHRSMTSKDVADAVMYVLGTPPHVQVCEVIIRPVGEKL